MKRLHLPARQTLDMLHIPRTTVYRWYAHLDNVSIRPTPDFWVESTDRIALDYAESTAERTGEISVDDVSEQTKAMLKPNNENSRAGRRNPH